VPLCSDRLSVQRDKAHILFGGTRIMQHDGDKAARIRTPDNGCLAVVLRTGFDTSQGEWCCHTEAIAQLQSLNSRFVPVCDVSCKHSRILSDLHH
jgi:magnesium-transporting ATPase (P-type)